MTEQEKTLIISLKEKGMSFGDISKRLNISRSTISTFYSSYLGSKDKCKNCGCTIVKKTKRFVIFCSDSCRNKWWNKHKSEINHRKLYTFVCACCGREFSRVQKKNYKYCSYDCFRKQRGGKDEG